MVEERTYLKSLDIRKGQLEDFEGMDIPEELGHTEGTVAVGRLCRDGYT